MEEGTVDSDQYMGEGAGDSKLYTEAEPREEMEPGKERKVPEDFV